jgi:hydrogenase nickel incorporation protein HypA/HybF
MHELSIAMSIVDGVLEEAARHGGARVETVYLRLGPLSGVDKEALRFSFQVASQETPLAQSQLLIEDVDVLIDCPACGAERRVKQLPVLTCAECGTLGTRVVQGEEMEITRLELAA